MKLPDVRKFTAVHWILLAAVAVCGFVAVVQVAGGLGFRWDPFNSAVRRADRAEGQLVTANSNAVARSAEAAGAKATTQLVERAATDRAAATEIVHRYAIQLEAQPREPAHETNSVPDDGADLRAVFGELCGLRPAVCADAGYSASPRGPGDGPTGLPDSRPAR